MEVLKDIRLGEFLKDSLKLKEFTTMKPLPRSQNELHPPCSSLGILHVPPIT
jgi:hypothetical protein